jgi:hypothetical protein
LPRRCAWSRQSPSQNNHTFDWLVVSQVMPVNPAKGMAPRNRAIFAGFWLRMGLIERDFEGLRRRTNCFGRVPGFAVSLPFFPL